MDDNESLPGLPGVIDVPEKDLDKLGKIPLRAQQVGALLACGFTCADIDNAFSLSDGTARSYKSLYFTRQNIDLTPQTRDKIIAAFLRNKSLQLVVGITPAKVADAGVGELAKSATMLMSRAQDLEDQATGPDRAQVLSNALSLLAQQSQAQRVTKEITDK